jgi:isopentenyldiphosphate isomerase
MCIANLIINIGPIVSKVCNNTFCTFNSACETNLQLMSRLEIITKQKMGKEIFDIVNERDEVVGQNTRREVHARGLWHRAVHVLVFNARGEVFLQKRSMKKDIAAGKWDSSASGHLDSGEDYDACAVREVREEIGLRLSQTPQRLFKIDARQETGWEFCWIYRCESEGPFVLHPDEIESGDWFAPDEVTKWVNEKPQEFASAFVLIWKLLKL